VKTSSVRIGSVTVSVIRGSVILGRWQFVVQTVWWKVITDKNVMEGRESKRALQIIKYTTLIS